PRPPAQVAQPARPLKVGTPFTFPGGLTVNVTGLRPVVASAGGPGMHKGQRLLVADLQVTNGGGDPVQLDDLGVQTRIGSTQRSGTAVSDPAVKPGRAKGRLVPGREADGSYAFGRIGGDETAHNPGDR